MIKTKTKKNDIQVEHSFDKKKIPSCQMDRKLLSYQFFIDFYSKPNILQNCLVMLIDFNGMWTHLGLFYV